METSAAKKIVSDCSLTMDQLVAHIQLLAERWSHWHDKGRPTVAAAYRQFAYTAIEFIRLAYNIALDDLKQKVGLVGGYRRLILDVIWPDWEDEEKQRLMRALSSAVSKSGQPAVSERAIAEFTDFVACKNLQTYFWVLKSFEDQAFGGHRQNVKAMQKDIQSLALSVEHFAESLVATEQDLMPKLQSLWSGHPKVATLIDKNSSDTKAACQGLRSGQTWVAFSKRMNALRNDGPEANMSADLLSARFIRGAVHYQFPVNDQFELEGIFVGLLRASLFTFCHVRNSW